MSGEDPSIPLQEYIHLATRNQRSTTRSGAEMKGRHIPPLHRDAQADSLSCQCSCGAGSFDCVILILTHRLDAQQHLEQHTSGTRSSRQQCMSVATDSKATIS